VSERTGVKSVTPTYYHKSCLSDLARIRTYLCFINAQAPLNVQHADSCPLRAKFRVVVSSRRLLNAVPVDLTRGPEVAPPEVFGSVDAYT